MNIKLRAFVWFFLTLFSLMQLSSQPAQAVGEFLCTAVTEIPQVECLALVALYNRTNGSNWIYSENWLVTTTPSNWYGVTVVSGYVTQLNLKDNRLSGVIPSELGSLSRLAYLDLSVNQLSGAIPLSFGNLSNLAYLYLNDNQLTGTIPVGLGNLSNLSHLYLGHNQLGGSIPSQLGSLIHLTYLDISSNRLTAAIPPQLGNLSSLAHLYLNNNQLIGGIPPELSNLTLLERLYLYDNLLTGPIPPSLGNLTFMWNLWLSGNQLTGSIPKELGQLSGLVWLRLADNQLSGIIPEELGNLTGLWQLSLANNQLTGEIPASLGNLTNLLILSLAGNQLSGPIPPQLGDLPNLYELDLSSNQLSGVIPPEFGSMINLEILLLNDNQLTGDIPDITLLEYLILPGELDGSDGLNLDYNALTIPEGYPDPASQLQLFLNQHDPDWHTLQAFEQIVDSTGGVLTALDDRTSIIIPAGTLSDFTTFTFTPLPAPTYDPGELVVAHHNFKLAAEDIYGVPVETFNPSLIVTLTYLDVDIVRTYEASLLLYYWNSGIPAWMDAVSTCSGGAYTRNLVNNTISLPLCHLSEFTVLGQPFPHNILPLVVR
jgi:Leucine-rich repeat (LRR) protein